MNDEHVSDSTEIGPTAAATPPPTLADLTPAELAAVLAARKQAVVDASKAGAPRNKREVVGLLALHGFTAVEQDGALRIDVAPIHQRSAANAIFNALTARGVRFGSLKSDGPRIKGIYDVMEEATWILVSGVDDRAIAT